jgi:uncharacterized protein YqfA (UPF0365 family)
VDTNSFLQGLAVGAGGMLLATLWVVVNRAWRHAFFSGAAVPLAVILGMRLRGTPPALIIDAYVALKKRGREASLDVVEATYLADAGRSLDPDDLANLVDQHLGSRSS